jgi:hypothetical protein
MFSIRLLIFASILSLPQMAADLTAVKAEPDLNKRAELAMDNAEHSLDGAAKAYNGGNTEQAHAQLADVQASVELACDSLRDTKSPPRNNKYYKRVELSMRTLLRHIGDLDHLVPYEDQASLEKVQKRVQELHDQILLDIMSKRK